MAVHRSTEGDRLPGTALQLGNEKPRSSGAFNAPRETRTPTGHMAHKALNLVTGVSVVSDASRFGLLEPFGWTHWTHCEHTELTRQDKELTERVEALTSEIHSRVQAG
jgi:hypothetical protein